MPEQQPLFDSSTYARPTTSSETMRSSVPGISSARQKMQANRDRIAGSPASVERSLGDESDEDVHSAHMTADYGIPVRGAAKHLTKLTPFDNAAFRRHGRYEEMPLHGNGSIEEGGWGTGQHFVHPGRVAEIAADPKLGVDPRFPVDRPLVADVAFNRNGRDTYAPVLHNGNHRVAAAVERGELFTPVTRITKAALPAAVNDARDSRARFKGARDQRIALGWDRMLMGDATFQRR